MPLQLTAMPTRLPTALTHLLADMATTLLDVFATPLPAALEEFEPAFERVVVAAEVQATRAAAKLEEARELKEAVRAGFESKAREAAAAAADWQGAAEDRKMAARDRAHTKGVIERKCAVELAVLCTCMTELEEENIGLEDTVWRLWEMLQRAKEGQYYRCLLCSEA